MGSRAKYVMLMIMVTRAETALATSKVSNEFDEACVWIGDLSQQVDEQDFVNQIEAWAKSKEVQLADVIRECLQELDVHRYERGTA